LVLQPIPGEVYVEAASATPGTKASDAVSAAPAAAIAIFFMITLPPFRMPGRPDCFLM
jgi:hypothetical protein